MQEDRLDIHMKPATELSPMMQFQFDSMHTDAQMQKFRKELQYLLDYELIEPSTSPWAAPMIAVPKRGSEDLQLVVIISD